MPTNCFSCSGFHCSSGSTPTGAAAGDGLCWKHRLGPPASVAETGLGAAGLPSQPASKSCLLMPDHKIYACIFPSTSAFPTFSLVKSFPTISIKKTEFKHSLFCAACFLLFPTQSEFSLPNWRLLALQQQRREARPLSMCCLLAEQVLVQGKVSPGISFHLHAGFSHQPGRALS